MVQPTGAEGAVGGLRAGARMHGGAPVWVGALGKYYRGAGSPIQSHGSPECRVPHADSAQFYRQGKASRRGIFAGAGGRYGWWRGRTCRAAGDSSDFRNHHWTYVVEVDSVLPGFAGVDESVEQRGALGIAHEIIFAHAGILLAGRAYGAR